MATFDERLTGEQPQATLPPQIAAQSLAPPAASVQEAPQSAQPQPNPQIAADLAEANTAIKEARQSIDDQKRIAEQKAQAQAPVIARMQQLASQPLPERKPAVQAPPAPQRSDPNADENWLFASAILGSLAGALTRRHQTNALAAFSGAVQGYQEGSQLKFDQNMKIWEAENKRAIEANQQAQQEYKDILENRKLSMEQMSIELQLTGQKYDDQAMVTTARTNNLLHIAQLLDTRARYAEQADAAATKIAQSHKEFLAKQEQQLTIAEMRANGINNPQQAQARIDQIGQYRAAPVQGRWGNALMKEVAEQYPQYDATKYAEKQRAVIAFATGIEGRQVQSLNVAISHLGVLQGLADQLENRNSPTWNFYANIVQQELGYAAPDSFDAVKQIVGAEVMKSVVPGGGGVTERTGLAQNANSSKSPDQLRGVIRSYEKLLVGQMEGLKQRYEDTTGLKDFEQRLNVGTKGALAEAAKPLPPANTFPMGIIAPRKPDTGQRDWWHIPGTDRSLEELFR